MKAYFTTIAGFLFLSISVYAQKFPVDTIYKSGSVDNRVNIVILGDGFTNKELPVFVSEATKFADFFLSYAPYNRYKDYFNIVSISTPSKESGITNPGTAPDAYPEQPVVKKDTYLGASFGSHIHRLVTISNYTALSNVLAVNFPTYDLVIVLVNSSWYGGSGGSLAVHTLHDQANKIGIHEIGHTLTRLNDEYWAGKGYGWEAPNMTENGNASTIKWKNWLNAPDVGIFKHGSGDAEHWFKPTNTNCLMEVLHKEFCAVCREATVERILELVDPVEKLIPDNTETVLMNFSEKSFILDLIKPNPSSLAVEWRLDDKLLNTKGTSITLSPAMLAARISNLTAAVFDSTFTSRQDDRRARRTKLVSWKLERKDLPLNFRIRSTADTLCAGERVILTATGCPGPIKWSTGDTSESITVTPTGTTRFTAKCSVDHSNDVFSDNYKIVVRSLPLIAASNTGPYFVGAEIQLKASANDYYLWTGPDQFRSTLRNPVIPDAKESNAGIYQVEAKSRYGCVEKAWTEVAVDPLVVVDNGLQNAVQVFPNPARESVFIKVKLGGPSNFILYDLSGRELLRKTFVQSTQIATDKMESGSYVYRLSNGDSQTSGKLLLE